MMRSGRPPASRIGTAVLLIIAHPDDESMFFLPTIRHFQGLGHTIYVLCLSTGASRVPAAAASVPTRCRPSPPPLPPASPGNAYGLGPLRTQEMCYACSLVGIGRDCVQVVDDAQLQDGMQTAWPLEAIAAHVEAAAKRWRPQTLVTFDAGGVSGHPNHIAVAAGVARAAAALRAEGFSGLELWQLVSGYVTRNIMGKKVHSRLCAHHRRHQNFVQASNGMLRQYIGALDVLISLLACKVGRGPAMKCCVAPGGPAAAWPAMRAHASQFVWFRKLFVIFSSYVYVNTLIAVT